MEAISLLHKIVDVFKNCELPNSLGSEMDLERVLRHIARDCAKEVLKIDDEKLADIVFSHGETRGERKSWTKSKSYQNVVVYGCSNTGDIFIRHPNGGSIYIEIKLSKKATSKEEAQTACRC